METSDDTSFSVPLFTGKYRSKVEWRAQRKEKEKKKAEEGMQSNKKNPQIIVMINWEEKNPNASLLKCLLLQTVKHPYSRLCCMTRAIKYFLYSGLSTENTELNFLKANTS